MDDDIHIEMPRLQIDVEGVDELQEIVTKMARSAMQAEAAADRIAAAAARIEAAIAPDEVSAHAPSSRPLLTSAFPVREKPDR